VGKQQASRPGTDDADLGSRTNGHDPNLPTFVLASVRTALGAIRRGGNLMR
jgi:hypothetical protein